VTKSSAIANLVKPVVPRKTCYVMSTALLERSASKHQSESYCLQDVQYSTSGQGATRHLNGGPAVQCSTTGQLLTRHLNGVTANRWQMIQLVVVSGQIE